MPLVPRLLLLTDRCGVSGGTLCDLIETVGHAPSAAWVFREKDMDLDDRRRLGEQVAAACCHVEVPLIVASDVALAVTLGAAGVHLAANDPMPTGPFEGLVGRSCHNAAEVGRAVGAEVDYVTFSPVYATASKPGYGPALGLVALSDAAGLHAIPILALGGIGVDAVADCVTAGAAGVAVMGALTAADDPRRLVAALVGEMATR